MNRLNFSSMKKAGLGVVLALLFSTSAFSQGRMISYQGIILNGTAPATGPVSLKFSIYTAATGGTAIWTETQPSVAVTAGVFNVWLGSVTPIAPLTHSATGYYLGVSVNGAAEMAPRSALSDVTSAFYADTAAVAMKLVGGGGGVSSVNTLTGAVVLAAGAGTTITPLGNTLTIAATGTGTGILGVQNTDQALTITNGSGPAATINVATNGIKSSMVGSGTATSGQVLAANGSGATAWVTPAGFAIPYVNSSANANPLFSMTNSGTAGAGWFAVAGGTDTASALVGTTSAVPGSVTPNAGVMGQNTGQGGNAGAYGVWGVSTGIGSSSVGVYGSGPNGSAYGVWGSAPTGQAVAATTNTGTGLWVNVTPGSNTHGKAAVITNTGAANTDDIVGISTAGLGAAVTVTSSNAASTKPAMWVSSASTVSTDTAFQIKAAGGVPFSINTAAGPTKASIDYAGTLDLEGGLALNGYASGQEPANPPTGHWILYVGNNGTNNYLFIKSSTGTKTQIVQAP